MESVEIMKCKLINNNTSDHIKTTTNQYSIFFTRKDSERGHITLFCGQDVNIFFNIFYLVSE